VARKAATVVFALIVVVVAAVGAAIGVLMARHGAVKLSGKVDVEGTSIGTFWFSPNDCVSGAAYVPTYLGANLHAAGGYGMRVVDSGDRARLWVFGQGGNGALTIDKSSCSQWDVAVDWAQKTANRVSTVNGHVRVKCAVGGGQVKADLLFERCER
jgi:hypothetical protein